MCFLKLFFTPFHMVLADILICLSINNPCTFFWILRVSCVEKKCDGTCCRPRLNIVMSFLTYTWLLSFELLAFSVCTFIYCLLRRFVKLMRIDKISRKICSHLLLFISIVYLEEYICAKEQKRGWQLLFGQLAMTTQLTFRVPPTSSSHAYKVKVI